MLLKEAPAHVVLKEIRRARAVTRASRRRCVPQDRPVDECPSFIKANRTAEGIRTRAREAHREGSERTDRRPSSGLPKKTIRNRLSSLFDKLASNDRLGLAVYAFEHGLLNQPA
jgi:hypothetical protein